MRLAASAIVGVRAALQVARGSRGDRLGLRAAGIVLCIGAYPVHADPAACGVTRADVRQDCLEAAAIPKPGSGELKPDDIGAPVDAPLSTDQFKPMAVDTLTADPSAVLHKPITVAPAQCFYFGVGDYRCVLDGGKAAVISTSIVIPPQAEVAVEHGCGDPAAGVPPGCSHRVMFVPGSVRTVPVEGKDTLLFRSNNVILDSPNAGQPDVTCPAKPSKGATAGCQAKP